MSSGFVLEKSVKNKNSEENNKNFVINNDRTDGEMKFVKKDLLSPESVKSFESQNNGYESDNDFTNQIERDIQENSSVRQINKLQDFENKKQILQTPPENVSIPEIVREIG